MCLAYGDALTTIFNQSFRSLISTDGAALGSPLPRLWGEAWQLIRPAVERARAGESTETEDVRLVLERNGQEETWWSFSCSPVESECGAVCGVLCIAQETTASLHERAYRSCRSELERITEVFSQAPGFTSFLSGPDHVYELASRNLDELAGLPVKGRPIRDAFPELDPRVLEMLREAYTQGRPISGRSVRLQRAGEIGRERYFDYMLQPVTDNSGAVAGVFVEAHDVTDRVVTDAEHRRREESLRLAVDAGRMAVVEVDLTTHEVDETPELRRLWGVWTQGPLILEDLQALILPEELARLHGLVADAHLRGASFFEAEYQYKRADTGAVRWMLARGRPIQSGAARKFMGVLMDVTDRREAQERLLLLAKEVDHRANNLLSTVQSIVSLTRSEDILEFRESVLGRILALAHTHRLLAESGWAGASLKRVVSEELRPFATTDQIRVEGEDIKLTPAVAQGVAVALHELATNAAKYGALSVQDGVVDLTWTRPKARGLVEMDWRERGGPEVRPPSRAGFGTNLLRRALSGAIGGSVALDWRADGLHCSLRFPPGSDGPQPAR